MKGEKKRTKKVKEKRPTGRPTIYTQKKAGVICALLAEGYSLRKICALPDMPAMSTVMKWLFEPSEFRDVFMEQYRRARESQAEVLADELIDIADDSTEDEVFTDEGKRMLNKEFVQRSKLRVETRQWCAVRLRPKVYGPQPQEAVNNADWAGIGAAIASALAQAEAPGNNN